MSKRVLILSASHRPGSNSEALARAFEEGAKEAGNDTELIRLAEKKIAFCCGCLACQELKRCVIADDAVEIAEKMKNADVLVFATPIYYYEMSGQLKVMLDRANPLYPQKYRFRDVYLLASAAEDSEHAWKNAANGVAGWVECFEEARFAGTVFTGGHSEAGAANPESLEKARTMGRAV